MDEFYTGPDLLGRYSISTVTLWRWLRDPNLGFPTPTIINRRRYFRRADIAAWESRRSEKAA
jgi:hypothetical protein